MKIRLEDDNPLANGIGVLITDKSKHTKPGFVTVLHLILTPVATKHENSAIDPGNMKYYPRDFLQTLFDAMFEFGFRPSIESSDFLESRDNALYSEVVQPGYYWAMERGDKQDANLMLVFVELDQSIWYGKVKFNKEDFLWMVRAK